MNLNFFKPSIKNFNKNNLFFSIFDCFFGKRIDFKYIFLKSLYTKIFLDCLNKTNFLEKTEKEKNKIIRVITGSIVLDVNNNYEDKGLIDYIVNGLIYNEKITIFYNKELMVVKNNILEKEKLSFSKYVFDLRNSEIILIEFYLNLIEKALNGFNQALNIANAVQFKVNGFREKFNDDDWKKIFTENKETLKQDASKIVDGLKDGKGLVIDKNDELKLEKYDIEAVKSTIETINKYIAGILGFPLSYITGEAQTNIATSLNQEENIINRGLKKYWIKYFKPILEKIFEEENLQIEFKRDFRNDFENLAPILNQIENTELIDEDIKIKIVEDLLNLNIYKKK